jgi:uncharacterized membrane protein (UPF0182 family)
MIVIIGGGIYGGNYLDTELMLKFPVFTVVLSLASVFLAIYIAIKDFIKK